MKSSQIDLTHSITINAEAETAFSLINDVDRWADVFPPCEAARVVEQDGNAIVIEVTACVGESIRTWRSKRLVDKEDKKVTFSQVDPYPPISSMSGYWQVVPEPQGGCRIILTHRFEVTRESASMGDPPRSIDDAVAWIKSACEKNSRIELESFRKACE